MFLVVEQTKSLVGMKLFSSNSVVPKEVPKGTHDQFLGDPWIHFCNDYFGLLIF